MFGRMLLKGIRKIQGMILPGLYFCSRSLGREVVFTLSGSSDVQILLRALNLCRPIGGDDTVLSPIGLATG
jgi:hypothetical protein